MTRFVEAWDENGARVLVPETWIKRWPEKFTRERPIAHGGAQPADLRGFAEPETHPEAFIPACKKRKSTPAVAEPAERSGTNETPAGDVPEEE